MEKTNASNNEIVISTNGVEIYGILTVPQDARGIVLFAHGSGSSRFSPRNIAVARVLEKAKLATLLLDLLTTEEEKNRANVFDINLLSKRLKGVTKWVRTNPSLEKLAIGYFGASTGAGAALQAAAKYKEVKAVVSRGGRPDLAMPYLEKVSAPTLLIVGGDDTEVIALNKLALEKLEGTKKLAIVPGATHLFEEPGTMEQVEILARDWFSKYLS